MKHSAVILLMLTVVILLSLTVYNGKDERSLN